MPTLDQLLADLISGDERRAESAAVQFVLLGEPAFTALSDLTQDPNPDHRWWALRALSEFTKPGVSSIFLHALSEPNQEIQACAALGLRLHPNPEAIPILVSLLGHPEQLLSRLSGDALIAHGSQATQALIELIDSPDKYSQRTRLEATRALAEIQDPASISTLFKIYQEGSSMMQHWAEEGLTKLGIGMVFFDPNL
jgi:HEAT repeat protein